jgi:type I restriction enzyme R subunit
MAKKFKEAANRNESLGLTDDEIRFYDALANNESAVRELSDETLKLIAHELTKISARMSVSIGHSVKASAQNCG